MVNIVLFQPQIPQNTGNVARTCAVTQSRLHLIGPMGFRIEDKKLKRAGLTYWPLLDITYYDDFDAFKRAHEHDAVFLLSSKGTQLYTEAVFPNDAYLLFGREDAGVPEEVHQWLSTRDYRIPMLALEEARCLNLSTSVGIVLYEALRQQGFKDLS